MGETSLVYLTGPQVRQRYSITEMTLWRWLRHPTMNFPRPLVINRRRLFRLADVIAWESAQGRAEIQESAQ